MPTSHYIGQATRGELNCSRHCQFDDKLYVDELTAVGNNKTEVKMTSLVSTSPGFMFYLMKGQLGKGLIKHLFGLKYYLETGKTVNMENYADVVKNC